MTQKPKEPDIEQVKTLLRRLEEMPRDPAPMRAGRADDVVRFPSLQEDSVKPLRPVSVEANYAANDEIGAPPPLVGAEAKQSLTRWFVGGAVFTGGCAAAFLAWQGNLLGTQDASAERAMAKPSNSVSRTATPPTELERSKSAAPAAGGIATSAAAANTPALVAPSEASAPKPEPRIAGGSLQVALDAASRSTDQQKPVVVAQTAGEDKVEGRVVATPRSEPPVETPPVPARKPESQAAGVASGPVARPPLPDAESVDEELLRNLLAQGQQALVQGQVASARLLFRRAADLGSAEAALSLGDTFDPERLKAQGVRGVTGDIEQSIRWYEKADELGSSTAKSRLIAISGR